MNLFDLTGKVAVVTGSSRGIGRAAAEALAGQGAKVVISSRNQEACDEVAAAIDARHGGGTALAVASSLSDKATLAHLVDAARRAFGRIDVLVCNAASNPYFGPMGAITDAQFRKVLDNNIRANHWLIQMVAPEMRARRAGSIILVSSIGGLRGSPVLGAYAVSKAADIQLVRNMAIELGPDGVRINAVAPGLIRTEFARALWEDEAAVAKRLAATPLRRLGESEDVAGAIVYLAADASAYVTGQTIVVDGGITA